jgi:hypothetical protein
MKSIMLPRARLRVTQANGQSVTVPLLLRLDGARHADGDLLLPEGCGVAALSVIYRGGHYWLCHADACRRLTLHETVTLAALRFTLLPLWGG